jgi:FixJ family two-component response regulator
MTVSATVFVVDDDEHLRDSLSYLLESVDLKVETFASAQEFLEVYTPDRPGVLLLDMRMPGMNGLELQQHLRDSDCTIPIIILTGHGDVPLAVQSMKAGAVDFLQKPANDQILIDRIRDAARIDEQTRRQRAEQKVVLDRVATLTKRQRQVMDRVITGRTSKQIADEFCVSTKTIEVHRKNVLTKMHAESTVELVNMVLSVRGESRTR